MARSLRIAGAWAAVLALGLTGCGTSDDGGGRTPKTGAEAAASAPDRVEPLGTRPKAELPATVTSADGHRVTVRDTSRIVPLTGSLNEIVFTLGLGDNVVARDITATFEQARKLPVVTRAHDVSAESVLSLEPTVVLADSTTGPAEAVDQIRDAGIPLVVFDPAKGLDDVGPRIDAVAKALGVEKAGAELTARTERRIAEVRADIPGGTRGKKPRVAFLYLRGSASVYLLGGRESGASSLLEAAGAADAGKESGLKKDFTAITSEALAKAAPDAILVMTKGLDSVGGVDGLLKVPGVAETPAGLDRRVVSVDDGVLLNYGPRTDRVLKSLVKQLYEDGSA
ncbi:MULTISPECIES: ABC transporter substrate-binding protein [unclassified Streptomyces]|uniref:heme/hemin ABC transporter substrate-binding protein n=1 Tax=unclassified Streptomyces TaxID=2593676 RepID=UPI001368B10F|nr:MULTISPECIES: ABC transporter substrate-binding protein [unclassified Streptomyces]NEA04339.1 ABC transporter substrate-binding protein [Streptomyces sp. SID10116]MYY83060.1 ABC transporter substrate-binding protein [Streptomyces sp. SID335]MYZ15203.1 ABC transporter substrate-binding protein [Streptomyces sp. SID337]NDZ86672.1 ABC transporter substrate-binding protein [Streptomyces sp. SID10115]NEB47226.1 ABC transporter substrate-binding protein [Streptomyces sp. SID339]